MQAMRLWVSNFIMTKNVQKSWKRPVRFFQQQTISKDGATAAVWPAVNKICTPQRALVVPTSITRILPEICPNLGMQYWIRYRRRPWHTVALKHTWSHPLRWRKKRESSGKYSTCVSLFLMKQKIRVLIHRG